MCYYWLCHDLNDMLVFLLAYIFVPLGFKPRKASKGGGRRSERDKLLPEVKKLKSQGKSNRAIADLLNIGSATVSRWLT